MTTQGIMASGTQGLFSAMNFSEQGLKTRTSVEKFQNVMKQNSGNEGKTASAVTSKSTTAEKTVAFRPNAEESTKVSKSESPVWDASKEEAVDEQTELFEKVNKLLGEVKKVILDTLKISEDEFNQLMETMGISMFHLFEPEVLQQIVLTEAGAGNDIMQLLTNETMAGTLKELMQQVNQLVEQSGVSEEELKTILNSEEFAGFVKDKGTQEAVTENIPDFSAGMVFSAQEEQSVKKAVFNEAEDFDESSLSDDSVEKKEISFTAVKLGADGNPEEHTGDKEGKASSKESGILKEGTVSPGEQFIENLAASAGTKETDFTARLSQVNQIREIANQIIEQIKVIIRPTQTSLEMHLNPEHLGKVSLNIASREGVMTAQFTVQNQVAKEAIESQMHMLKANLENQGIKVAAIEVSVSDFDFDQRNGMEGGKGEQQRESAKKRSFIMEDEPEFNDTAEEMMISQGFMGSSSIDYTA